MISLYEDLLETRVRIHEINECNLGNKFIEKICEQKQVTPEYKFPVLENTSFIEKDLLFLENLERLLDDNNRAFLENYQAAAEATNPIGLVADKVSKTSWDPESLDYLYNQVKDALRSNSIDMVDDLIEKSAVPGMCFGRPLSDMISCDKEHIMESVFTVEKNHNLTKEDITEAVEVIKQTKNKIKDIKDKAAEKIKDRKQKICNMKKDMEQAAKEVCRKPCAECCLVAICLEMEDMINHAEIVALETQMIEELSQARSNIARTAFHNPRNVRESAIWTDMVGEYTTENFMELIDEVAESDEIKIVVDEAFESIRSKVTLSNKKFLKKYEQQALASNCDGIMMKKYYIPVTGLEKKCNDLIKEVETEFKKGLNDDDPDEMKRRFKEIRGSFMLGYTDGESAAKNAKVTDEKPIVRVKKLAVKEELNHKVTKQDVQFAVKYLKDVDKRIDDAEREYQKICGGIDQAFYVPLRTLGRTKGEKYVKKIERITKETVENIQLNYQKIKLSQLKVMQQQSRKVILLAARTKATEAEISDMEYLNSLLESYMEEMERDRG